ncbi:MAG: hypothetical protein JWO73_565 [Candidatus Taylorbacteria bacterium]|nr:hypothetical protein [Candidatus Taylorbacteria bacterium]
MNTILLYYKYADIADPEKLASEQRELCARFNFKSRIIVAKEGINGTLEGKTADTEEYIRIMRADPRFADMHFKKSEGTPAGDAFHRASVKVRKEIVSAHLDDNDPKTGDVNPTRVTGKRLTPEELHRWYEEGREFTIVDMRNDYEHVVGHFRGSILPKLSNFRDLPQVTERELVPAGLKQKTVLTVCTGGVRCEKASGYLVKRGFEDVYQLDGGIVSYMEKYPGKDFLGSLYVFDERKTMHFTPADKHQIIGKCEQCKGLSERYVNCANLSCHAHIIVCQACAPAEAEAFCAKCKK